MAVLYNYQLQNMPSRKIICIIYISKVANNFESYRYVIIRFVTGTKQSSSRHIYVTVDFGIQLGSELS